MRALIKAVFAVVLLSVLAVGWVAWRNEQVRRQTRKVVGGKIDQELVWSAQTLSGRLRFPQKIAETNKALATIIK